MDSVTQFLLGAGISGALLGPRLGRRALLLGGVVATLPDLDSLVSMGNAIDNMTYHRGFSHSVLIHTVVAPIIAWGLAKSWQSMAALGASLYLTVWLCLVTHPMLDSLTTYGTQILWPLDVGPPTAFPSIFIIDPLYSGLLLIGFIGMLLAGQEGRRSLGLMRTMLAISTVYLIIGMAGHVTVMGRAEAHEGFDGKSLHVQPTPFNILFWQVLAADDTSYETVLTGLLPGCPLLPSVRQPRHPLPPKALAEIASARRLEWFTDGFYSYGREGENATLTDLRLGFYPNFVFSFLIGRENGEGMEPVEPSRLPLKEPRGQALGKAWQEIKAAANACWKFEPLQ